MIFLYFWEIWSYVTRKNIYFLLFIIYFFCIFIRSHLGKTTFFLQMKTTQNKPKGYLTNTTLNQTNLIKKITANQTRPEDWPSFDPIRLTNSVDSKTNQNKNLRLKQIQHKKNIKTQKKSQEKQIKHRKKEEHQEHSNVNPTTCNLK
jgi:hypothetical protein